MREQLIAAMQAGTLVNLVTKDHRYEMGLEILSVGPKVVTFRYYDGWPGHWRYTRGRLPVASVTNVEKSEYQRCAWHPGILHPQGNRTRTVDYGHYKVTYQLPRFASVPNY